MDAHADPFGRVEDVVAAYVGEGDEEEDDEEDAVSAQQVRAQNLNLSTVGKYSQL